MAGKYSFSDGRDKFCCESWTVSVATKGMDKSCGRCWTVRDNSIINRRIANTCIRW